MYFWPIFNSSPLYFNFTLGSMRGPLKKKDALTLLSSSLMALISAKTRAICCQTAGGQKLKKWIYTTDVRMMLT